MENKPASVHRLLLAHYGTPKHPHYDPVETLVLTILSQNTNDTNRDRAYQNLRKAFSSWKSTASAPAKKLENTIRVAGLSKAKAKSIQEALLRIRADFGKFSLDSLKPMALEDARQYLLSIKGVGPKTAAVVLCFSLGFSAFPVDTHIYRVSKRLGLIPEKTSVEKAHMLLEKSLQGPSLAYPLHINIIRHGRDTCTARKPKCPGCVLRKICAYKNKTR